MIQVLHNPRCGKSRSCLAFLTNLNLEFETIKYLENRLNFIDLQAIISKLACKPIELVRPKEKMWIENYKNMILSDAEIIQIMVENPILIERPVVIKNDKAVIARPLENLKMIL